MMAAILLSALLGLVPTAQNLHESGTLANANKHPILLYVSRSDCVFCRRFEKQLLGPLLKSGLYQNKITILELVWDAPEPIINFTGHRVSRSEFADTLRAKLTPTLLFLDGEGKEIVPRITGYNTNDYYGYYLESAILKAYEHMQNTNQLIE